MNFFMQKPQLVLFDLDGTLVDSVPDLAYSVDCAMQMLDMPMHGEDKVRTWVGRGADRLMKAALTGGMDGEPDPDLFQKAFDLFSDIYLQNTNQRSHLYMGVYEGLGQLQAMGIPLACVTNKRGIYTDQVLRGLGLDTYFSMVVSGDTLTRKKPDPDQLLYAAQAFNLAPEQCLMVGDSISDLNAARAANMPVVCVSYGYNHGESIANYGPDRVINSLMELTGLFPV